MYTRFLLTILFIGTTCLGTAQLKRFTFTESKMGAPLNIIMYCSDSIQANHLAAKCYTLVDSFVVIFSDYIDSSELSKLSATAGIAPGPVSLSPAMFDMLMLSKMAFNKSNGAFDITIGPLVKLWRKARKLKQFPTKEQLQLVSKLVGFNNLIIDAVNKTATLLKKGMQLDLGGIAQGYIAQKIIDFLRAQNIEQALVNVSGDIVTSNAPPGSNGWQVGVNVPETTDELLPKTLQIQNRAVTTSGDAYQYVEHNGKRYSHIIDPRTGYGLTSQRNVTAIAKDGATADWLATACSILSIKKAKKLAKQLDAEILIGQLKNGKLIFHATPGFNRFWKLSQ